MGIKEAASPEHPFQRFFTSVRPQPTFQWERHQQRDVLVITHPKCQAVFSRQGAQLLHFQPNGQRPWLWCSSQWPQVGAIRGGVPVCWPWVGRHPEEGGWPANGWGRLLDWKLIDSQAHEEGVSLHWRLSLWDWQADLYAELGQGMDLRLETRHEDTEPCQFGHALHTYWRISDIADVALDDLDGALKLKDDKWQRRLSIDTCDSANTAVWHPGSRPLLGVAGHEVAGFVRVEAACGVEDCMSLAPGQQARLSLQVSLV